MQMPPARSAPASRRFELAALRDAALVAVVALLLRLYKLDAPIWLDEAYSYLLTSSGPTAILANISKDPHPPLYYFIQGFAAAIAGGQGEIAWRWLSALSGALAVGLVVLIVRALGASRLGSLAGGLLLATLPAGLYYSQEARPYAFLLMLTATSLLLALRLAAQPARPGLWAGWATLSIVGLYSGYNYLAVLGVQALFLGAASRWGRRWLLSCLAIGAALLPLLAFAPQGIAVAAAFAAGARHLSVGRLLGALLFDDPGRYGSSPLHLVMPLVLLPVAALGVWRLLASERRGFGAYLLAQVVAPPLLFFGLVSPLTGITLQLHNAKQFFPLLAPLFVLVGVGLDYLLTARSGAVAARVAQAGGALLVVCVLGANAAGLARYWSTPKSPEGLAVLLVRKQRVGNEPIANLHYSTGAVLGFYLPGVSVYQDPRPGEGGYTFALALPRDNFALQPPEFERFSVASIASTGRLWVIAQRGQQDEPRAALLTGCSAHVVATYGPFDVWLGEACAP